MISSLSMNQYSSSKPGDKIYRVPLPKPWRVFIAPLKKQKEPKASLWTLVYGFAGMICIGTLLLMLPFSSKSGQPTFIVDALFTATSSVCVTGLVVVDTLDHWTFFGQLVILLLIQFGGFGYMTITTLILIALGRRVGLRERLLVGESLGLSKISDVVKLSRYMALFTLIAEVIGAAIFYVRFSTEYAGVTAIWKSIFQAVSAFNNAGFDIFGNFRSLSNYQHDCLVILTTAALVIIGGISFLVIEDVIRTRRIDRFSIDTKMVLSVTGLLLALGTILTLATEYTNHDTIGGMTIADKMLNAFFQSVTSRTSGFNTISIGTMTDYALFVTMLLMFIGGASGSTAGGIKVNTFGLILATIWSSVKGREYPSAFGREFAFQQIFRALAILVLSLMVVATVVFVLTIVENFRFLELLFETISAFGTVGLSTGITPDLSVMGRLIIVITMFTGRLGPLTLTLALVKRQQVSIFRYPKGTIRLG